MPGEDMEGVVVQRGKQTLHGCVVATALCKMDQLRREIARWFSSEPGIVALWSCAPLLAVASGAGEHALFDGGGRMDGLRCRRRECPQGQRAGDSFQLGRGIRHAERYGADGATFWAARRNPR